MPPMSSQTNVGVYFPPMSDSTPMAQVYPPICCLYPPVHPYLQTPTCRPRRRPLHAHRLSQYRPTLHLHQQPQAHNYQRKCPHTTTPRCSVLLRKRSLRKRSGRAGVWSGGVCIRPLQGGRGNSATSCLREGGP